MSKIEEERKTENVLEVLQESLSELDSETEQIYTILQERCPEILILENFNISAEKIQYYTQKHFEIYEQKSKELLKKGLPQTLVLSSGMFGGKTTLSFFLLDALEQKGKKTEMLIADVMQEDCVTARSYRGGRRCHATRFGHLTDYEATLERLFNSDVEVVFLDEFSFLDVNVVDDLKKMCEVGRKNLILTGLNTSYLGMSLPAFQENSKILKNSQIEQCYSFVTGFCEDKPLGTSTIRYVKMANKWVLDVGLLPLIVSKEKTNIVHYAPGMFDHTAVYILQDNSELLNKILFPSIEKKFRQKTLLERLEQENAF